MKCSVWSCGHVQHSIDKMDNLAWDEAEKLEVDVMNVKKAKLGSDH